MSDQVKLDRVLTYLNGTRELGINLSTEEVTCVHAYVDASFACETDMVSRTGGFITLGRGHIHVMTKKQKLVSKSSSEAELVGNSDALPQVIWTRDFLISQGHPAVPAILYQDNMPTISWQIEESQPLSVQDTLQSGTSSSRIA